MQFRAEDEYVCIFFIRMERATELRISAAEHSAQMKLRVQTNAQYGV